MNSFTNWDDELYHHGIKGQKWGHRRWQNEDGSLTAAGREHYGYGKNLTEEGIKAYKKEYKKLQKLKDRTDMDKQRQIADKYNKRAVKALAVAGGLGAGSFGINRYGLNAIIGQASKQFKLQQNQNLINNERKIAEAVRDVGQYSNLNTGYKPDYSTKNIYDAKQGSNAEALQGRINAIYKNDDKVMDSYRNTYNKVIGGARTAQKVMAAGAAVSAGYAAYSKIRAHAAEKRLTEIGHAKAVAAYQAQNEKMLKMFGDVDLSSIINKKQKK